MWVSGWEESPDISVSLVGQICNLPKGNPPLPLRGGDCSAHLVVLFLVAAHLVVYT